MIRVLVVDDHDLLRAGLVTVLGSDPAITVVGEARSGPESVRLADELRPDLVLMDVEMPGGDGVAATREITTHLPMTRVLVLTMFDLDDYVVESLRAGASGYLLKATAPDDLLRAVRAAATGQATVSGDVLDRVLRPLLGTTPEPVAGITSLTDRETDVLRAMARGLSNSEIGTELYLAETTVKTHVARILTKLGVRDRLQAVVAAHRAGIDRACPTPRHTGSSSRTTRGGPSGRARGAPRGMCASCSRATVETTPSRRDGLSHREFR